MKVVIATLLFISAAGAIRNLVGLPEASSSRLHHLLKDGPIDAKKLTNPSSSKTTAHLAGLLKKSSLNDHGEGGHGPGEGGSDPLKALAESIGHIGPALKKLKETRDKKSEERAKELLDAVKSGKDGDHLKMLLGRHVVAQHQDCVNSKKKFANYVHKSVLVELLKEEDTLNFQDDLAKVFEAAEMYPELDMFEAFSQLADKHDLRDHPGIKAIMMIGGMIVDAACDEKSDGLFKSIGELVEQHDPHGEFDLKNRINLDIYSKNSRVCRHGFPLVKRHDPGSSIRERLLDVMNDPDCKEVNFMRFIIDTIMESIKVSEKFGHLHAIAKGYEQVVIRHVTDLMEHGHEDLAYTVVGEYLLANLRGALTVGLVVEKRLEPKPGSRPTGSRPTGTEAPSTEGPNTEGPSTEGPNTEAPSTEGPNTEAPSTEGPSTEGPSIEAPSTEGPNAEGPSTEGPNTEAPSTEGPNTEGPSTEGPSTEGPSTEGPSTEGPSTEAPGTEAPSTEAPGTEAPGTEAPGTPVP